ncbi:MAG TPA: hypothetical protein VMI10_02520 [Terriglobales bacterium]|nr:hypothetical protein [Terriglobales bacterium]
MNSATFTFRIPSSMAGRLTSAEMRAWIGDFLRSPHALPPDPGPGYERIGTSAIPRQERPRPQFQSFLLCANSWNDTGGV